MLLHLSEGVDTAARNHFLALKMASGAWAIAPSLAGIHSVGLKPTDLDTMQAHGAAVIWSPFSNFLLYGNTADVVGMKARGIRIGLGSDWSPSGSKNLLGELKVARLVSAALGNVFTDKELIAMATREAAKSSALAHGTRFAGTRKARGLPGYRYDQWRSLFCID